MEDKIQITEEQASYFANFANKCFTYYYTVGQDDAQKVLDLYTAKSSQYIFQRSRKNKLLNLINLKMKPGVDPGYDFEYYENIKVKVISYYDFSNPYATYSGPMQAADTIVVVAFDISKKRGMILFELKINELIQMGAMEAIDENTRRINVQLINSKLN